MAPSRTRTCAATGETLEEDQLLRFALGPEGIVPDVAAKLPGRGVWVRADRATLEQAIRKNAFARSLKSPTTVPSDLLQQTEALLARRCLSQLGLALKAGSLAVGGVQVEEAIRRGPPACLIEATDGADDGRARLTKLHFGLWGREPQIVSSFTAAEIGVALGRSPVVHSALLQESMAQRWLVDIGKLARVRAVPPPSSR